MSAVAPVEVPTQPGIDAQGALDRALAGLDGAQPAPEQVAAPVQTEPAFDPATIAIPATAGGTLEKFRGQNLGAIVQSYEEAQRTMHARAQEAATARRELEELKVRLAAAEQFQRMQPPAPQQPAPDLWQAAGLDPEVAIINDPRRVIETGITESERRARAIAAEEATKTRQEVAAMLDERDRAAAFVTTWEAAKEKARAIGYQITDEDWRAQLQYILPVIGQEGKADPTAPFNPDRYIHHFTLLRGGPPKATLPTEGAPPVASRGANVNPRSTPVPTLPAEQAAITDALYKSLKANGLVSEDQAGTAAMRITQRQR